MVRLCDFLLLLAAFLALGVGLEAFVYLALRPYWRRRRLRYALRGLLGLDLLVPSVWFALSRLGYADVADGLVTVQLGLCFGQLALGGGLVLVALLRAAGRLGRPAAVIPSERRRFLLQGAAIALPVMAGATGLGGVLESEGGVRVRRRTLRLPNLPARLDGLRILHFSDVHLWKIVQLPDLERALRRAPRGEYDLVCVTGDLADDMTQLPRALELLAGLDAPLGHFACLGNHEHSRDLPRALAAYADGPVDLLRGGSAELVHHGQPFVLSGIDDLRARPLVNQNVFYPDQLRRALGPTSPDAFTVLMSHRPSVFSHAAASKVDLVLSGHTHGGQMAIAGRSILELNGAAPCAWGVYRQASTTMHVTCGLGQWFPFRLGCPPEMVVLELRSETIDVPV